MRYEILAGQYDIYSLGDHMIYPSMEPSRDIYVSFFIRNSSLLTLNCAKGAERLYQIIPNG